MELTAPTPSPGSDALDSAALPPPWTRLLRRLQAPPSARGFSIDFSSRSAALAVFEEGVGSLTTGGALACMRIDHVQYDAPITPSLTPAGTWQRRSGARLLLDGQGVAACGNGVQIAVGHLGSRAFYSFGDFTWVARIHHSPDGGAPPPNSFTCFSTYQHGGGASAWAEAHNEAAWCFDGLDRFGVHLSFWVDEKMHRTILRRDDDLTRGLHTYTTRWRPQGIDWLIDDRVVHQTRGEARQGVPWEPQSVRIILRPTNRPSVLRGNAVVELASVSYTPAYTAGATATASYDASRVADLTPEPAPPPPPASPPPAPPPRRPGSRCRDDICGDLGHDCCAPAALGEVARCLEPGFEVWRGGRSAHGACVRDFGASAVYQCCGFDEPQQLAQESARPPPPPPPRPPPLPSPSASMRALPSGAKMPDDEATPAPASVYVPPFASADALRAEEDALVLHLVAVLLLLGCCGSFLGDALCRRRYQEVAVVAPDDHGIFASSARASGRQPDNDDRARANHGANMAARVADRDAESDEDDWYEL